MNRIAATLALLSFPTGVWAEAFARPIPQAQTETAEFWFLVASIALIVALIVVNWLVARR